MYYIILLQNQYNGVIYISLIGENSIHQIPLFGYGGTSDITVYIYYIQCYVLSDPVEMDKENDDWQGQIEIHNTGTRCATVFALLEYLYFI